MRAVALSIAQTIREGSSPARAVLETGAEQMAAGCLRYLGLAQSSPAWALLILDVAVVDPTPQDHYRVRPDRVPSWPQTKGIFQ